jgi:hypothetical protein
MRLTIAPTSCGRIPVSVSPRPSHQVKKRAHERIGPGRIWVADVGGEKLDVARQAAGSSAAAISAGTI